MYRVRQEDLSFKGSSHQNGLALTVRNPLRKL